MQRPYSPLNHETKASAASRRRLDALLLSVDPLWPLDQTHAAVGCRVVRALARRGRRVAMASVKPTPHAAQSWVTEKMLGWPQASTDQVRRLLAHWSGLGKDARFLAAGRLGLRPATLAGVLTLIDKHQPRVVMAAGPGAPALLSAVRAADRDVHTVWLGHDHATTARLLEVIDTPWRHKPRAAARMLSQTAAALPFARSIDHVAAAGRIDAALLAGASLTPCTLRVPHGINLTRFAPDPEQPIRPATAVTFAPDLADPRVVRSIEQFARKVWPKLLSYFPEARWHIVGPGAPPRLRKLEAIDGIKVVGPAKDLRVYAQRCRIALWPGRSLPADGKPLRQAMAMGIPCVTSLTAARALGVRSAHAKHSGCPLAACVGRRNWFERIAELWTQPEAAAAAGKAARAWVMAHADWQSNTAGLDGLIDLIKQQERQALPPETVDPAAADEGVTSTEPIPFQTAIPEDDGSPPLRRAA